MASPKPSSRKISPPTPSIFSASRLSSAAPSRPTPATNPKSKTSRSSATSSGTATTSAVATSSAKPFASTTVSTPLSASFLPASHGKAPTSTRQPQFIPRPPRASTSSSEPNSASPNNSSTPSSRSSTKNSPKPLQILSFLIRRSVPFSNLSTNPSSAHSQTRFSLSSAPPA